MKVKERPVEVEAVQWTGDNFKEVSGFVGHRYLWVMPDRDLIMQVPEDGCIKAEYKVKIGDWIIKDARGKIYPCQDDNFKRAYEPVTSTGWLDQPNKPGWWWMTRRIFGGKHHQTQVLRVMDFGNDLELCDWDRNRFIPADEASTYYPNAKWQYIPKPKLPEK